MSNNRPEVSLQTDPTLARFTENGEKTTSAF